MKNLLLISTILSIFCSTVYGVSIYSEDFSTDATSMFTPVADSNNAKSLTYN